MSSRRLARARAWLEARAPAEELLIVGASLDAANELARSVVQTTGAAFGWHRIALPQLAAGLAAPAMAERGVVSVGRLGVEAVVCRAVHGLRSIDALGRYAAIAEGPGFARGIANVLTELRLADLASEALGKVAPDLLCLYRAYEAELGKANLTDWPGMLAIATETVANGSPTAQRLVRLPMLLVDVPVVTKAELNLVATLGRVVN
jgi:ATP-dependent helicase/nuclease subunit B